MQARANIDTVHGPGQARGAAPTGGNARQNRRAVRFVGLLVIALSMPWMSACGESDEGRAPAPVEADSAALLPRQTRELILPC